MQLDDDVFAQSSTSPAEAERYIRDSESQWAEAVASGDIAANRKLCNSSPICPDQCCGGQKLRRAIFSAVCSVVTFQQKLRSGQAAHEAGRAARSDLRFQWLQLLLFVEVASHAPARLAEPNPYRPKLGRRVR